MKVKGSLNVTFDKSPPPTKLSPFVDDDVGEEEAIKKNTKVVNNNKEYESIEVDEFVNIKESKNHPLDQMLKKFWLEDSKPTKMPMSTEIKLTKDDEADSVDSSKYQENPKTTHLEAVKRIFRYIRGTSHLGLWYPKGTRIETIVYADSDHAGNYVDHKSTSDVCTSMGCCLTSWFAKKQTSLAISTTKAEYVSIGKSCQQALWMKQALTDYVI
nr:copia protein [Tanacetum cinerariifolium]